MEKGKEGKMICRKCKADALIYAARYGNMPKIECHHEPCWCEIIPERRMIFKSDGMGGFEINPSKAAFCPDCGRKL